ncbi:branched-chain amino acid ABC transporter permease [Pusillimonas noertemannii]|uniref:Amino acid/amide ABC transporter membrane protein 1 (HAAT family) n=1 Tax=Pusillimonas noertemannii TaxID=305977 RepID=A0A2U1CNW5_9BURK|nr:branched-chain amino acid ABC transporter permease [Pusillimonas noertemannii]NYT68286.1 branched-chain amino acid ABC transporter permease [Pusillimonas noertemannii]PVY62699.1 amino acid/amide ABC transporter membrane protein 1 (HAAT family) [Pusillimonas noertemannii]TFL10362.1 branched-chain amino acid ABC transporter permease [Pusillimonas noertemannii]
MIASLFVEQMLNGLQLGVMLFLIAAGFTLVFGIMNLVNLAHGSFYMIGAYMFATILQKVGAFWVSIVLAALVTGFVGAVLERLALKPFYRRPYLDQVLATLGLILFFNELTRIIWGPQPLNVTLPGALNSSVPIIVGLSYPMIRLVILAVGVLVALALYLIISRTRAGMLVRAGASNRVFIGALGINVNRVFSWAFSVGAALAGLAGALASPILAVEAGMGESVLIFALIVVVIGGIGSFRGAFVAAILVGLIDTFGRLMFPPLLGDISVYLLMAAILAWRPQGLFPAHG